MAVRRKPVLRTGTVQLMDAPSIPHRKGRERTYPLHTMDVGQFFFLPGKERSNLASYISHQSKKLNRKFVTRTQWMRRGDDLMHLWVDAREGEAGAERGLAIYRTD